jgi:exopolysaccharide production protein ExoQ
MNAKFLRRTNGPAAKIARRSSNIEDVVARQFQIRYILLFSAFFVLMFSNDAENAVIFQSAGVILLCAAAASCVVTARAFPYAPTSVDLVVFIIVFFSLVSSALNQTVDVAVYTAIFLVTYISIMIINRSLSEQELALCIFVSIVIVVAVVSIVYFDTLLKTLAPGAENRWALRMRPFNMHPNLTGYVFGGFITFIIFSNVNIGRFTFYLKGLCCALCVLIVLAASARAGLVALCAVIGFHAARAFMLGRVDIKYVVAIYCLVFIAVAFFWNTIAAYLTEILELNSSTRGFESGGSGRFELWQKGLAAIGDRTWELFFGSGLRSASQEMLGFSTENSYVTIALESGLLVLLLFVTSLVHVVLRAHKADVGKSNGIAEVTLYCIIFAAFESIFNRYLIAIGNPFSLIFLILISKFSLRRIDDARQRGDGRAARLRQSRLHPELTRAAHQAGSTRRAPSGRFD